MAQKQNINLLEELIVQPISAFNSKLILQISAVWILILALIYVVAYSSNINKEKELTKLESSKQKLSKKITSYSQKSLKFDGKIINLKDIPIGFNIRGFYRYLKDLSILTPHGVWLKEIIISEPDDTMSIKGSTITSFGVSALIKALSKSKNFQDKELSNLMLEENPDSNNIDFTISTINPNAQNDEEAPIQKNKFKVKTKKKESKVEKEMATDARLKKILNK